MPMYEDIKGCNLEIMGFPFYAEKVSITEAFRRRESNYNAIVGGTQQVTKGQYIGLEYKVTTHVRVDPNRPDEHNKIFQEMMSKPVDVISPELGGKFKANVIISPEHTKLNYLEVSITIKEIPTSKSLIPGESWVVPKTKKIDIKKKSSTTNSKSTTNSAVSKTKRNQIAGKSKSK